MSTPAPTGYANSKYIAEKLLDAASRECGIDASFARVGQVPVRFARMDCGINMNGSPSLVLSSLYVGALPDDIGSTLWTD